MKRLLPEMQTLSTLTTKPSDRFVEAFERLDKNPRHPHWLFPERKAALARFAELGFPTIDHEDWRFTNVQPILNLPFKPVLKPDGQTVPPKLLREHEFKGLGGSRLVFVNGHFSRDLSQIAPAPQGITVCSLSEALTKSLPCLEKFLPRFLQADQNAFAALNGAFFQDGAFVYVSAGQKAEPVHLVYLATNADVGTTIQPRNVIISEANSKLTIIESYGSTGDAPYFTNVVTDFVVGNGSNIEHLKLQDESASAYHLGTLSIDVGANVNFLSHSIALGAKLSRNSIITVLKGEGAECVLNGLYLTRDEQLADHWMRVEHAKAHCNSHEYFNGILGGRSRGVFHGRILVQQEAQKTDAKQTNKNLLLSDQATINAKPQLEIYADDVKCTHGATVGQLNQESIFYLRARGINLETARRILIHAFAGEILARIQCDPVRAALDARVWEQLEQDAAVADRKA